MGLILHHPGELVKVSGLYKVIHCAEYETAFEGTCGRACEASQRFVVGERFPTCIDCDELVGYLLIQSAPHILDDPDFASGFVWP